MKPDNISEKWDWGIGQASNGYYDYWAYRRDDKYELHMWWDKGENHSVEIIPINGFDENNDPQYGYPTDTCEFDTEDEAMEYAEELMEKYS